MRFAKPALLGAALGVLFAANLHADTLFSNLGQSGAGNGSVGLATDRVAADFLTDGSDATITGATLRLINSDNISHNVTVSLWSDSGSGTPGTLLGSFAPVNVPSANFGNYSFTSAGIALEANTAYWVVMGLNENFNVNGVGWQITASQAADAGSVYSLIVDTQAQYSDDGGQTWIDNFPFEFQYALLPEPGRFAQLGAGVLALVLLRRRTL